MHRVITTINITQRGLTNNYTIIGLDVFVIISL